MQALSTWSQNGYSEQCFSYKFHSSRRRNPLLGLSFPVCHCGKSESYCLLFSSSLRILKTESNFGDYSKFDVCSQSKLSGYLSKRKKAPFGSLFVLACALEQQESAENEFLTKDDSCSEVGFSDDLNLSNHENGKSSNVMSSAGESEGDRSGNIDVKALALSLHLAKTADDVEEVLKGFTELPLQVYSSMIRGFGRDKKIDSAAALVNWLKRKRIETNGRIGPNLFIYNSLLGAIKQSEQFGKMESVLMDMDREGVVPNVVTYNTIMSIYLDQGRAMESLNVLQEIQNKGWNPSPVSYSTALLAYRRMEDGNGALKFMIELKEKYVKGEIGKKEEEEEEDWDNEFRKLEDFTKRVCYQVMRNWLVRKDENSTKVLELLSKMDNAGFPLGRAEEERLVWACTRSEHYIVAKDLYDRIREKHSVISLSVCNHIIWVMGKAKKWWAALEIYEDLLDKGPKPNNMSYELIVSHFNILLMAARKRGIWRWGVRLLNKMEEKGLKPGSREWNSVLIACSKAAETSAAVEIFRRMVENGEKPTVLSYGALLSALEKGKLYDEARKVWDHMVKVGIEPNLYAYTTMVSVFTGQGKFNLVEALITDMTSAGIEPTVVTYNAIITGCARNNMSSAAYEWFHRMRVREVEPNEVTYEMLIEALTKEGKPILAYQMYMRAKSEELSLSAKAYDLVVQAARDYNASIDFTSLGPRPVERKKIIKVRKSLSEFCDLADVPRRSRLFDRREIYSSRND